MTANTDNRHPDPHVVFLGRVVASYSHEIRNILAIINESTGLMHDLLNLKKEELSGHAQRFTKTLEDIGQQIQRGQDLSTFLNTLAHAPDKEVGGVDIVHTMQTVFALSNRLLKNKKMGLCLEGKDIKLQVTTRPVECMHCFFCALEWAMTHSQADDEIVFQPLDSEQEVHINVSGWSLDPSTDANGLMTRLQDLVAALQGTCALQDKKLVITLPKQIES